MTDGAEIDNARQLEVAVATLGKSLGLEARAQARLGRRVWGAKRYIDVVLTQPETRLRLGVECKFQKKSGSAEEKIGTTLRDIEAWPIRGIVVIEGRGFSANARAYLLSAGNVVELEDLETWLRFFFGLELSA